MTNWLAGAASAAALIGAAGAAQAATYFELDASPSGSMVYLTAAKGVTQSTGAVAGDTVSIQAGVKSDFANGFSSISALGKGKLNTLTFTPSDPKAFDGFSFRGQDLAANQVIDIVIQDDQGHAPQTLAVSVTKANADFSAIGVIAAMKGETIKSVELINSGGFKEAKQFEFLKTPTVSGVPEPATWATMLVGFGGLGAVLRRRRLAAT